MANPYFNATYYLATNPDLAAAGITTEEGAWNHYVEYGASEERVPAPWFDGAYYLEQNPDLAEAGLSGADLFVHFGAYGVLEGRQPSAQSAAEVTEEALAAYAAANPDLRAAFGIEGVEITEEQYAQLANHFYLYGYNEDRPGAPVEYDLPEPVDPEEPSIPGETFMLTEGTDRGPDFTGTENDDTFLAYAHQNPYVGGIGNTLSSADHLDGGAGYDKLFAEIVPEYFGADGANQVDIQPRTTNIEQVEFEVRDLGGNSNSSGSQDNGFTASVDAKHMYGVERIGSKQSDGDLVIENLTTLANDGITKRNTSDLTITMDHTDNFNSDNDASDLTVYFDDNYLIAGQSFQAALELRIVNSYELAENNAPLTYFKTVNFKVGETEVVVDITDATTYQQVANAINIKLGDLGITGVTATVGAERTAVFTDDVGGYAQGEVAGNYSPVLIASTNQALTAGPVEQESDIEDFNGLNTWIRPDATTIDDPISVNIDLTKVGRGGDGGNLLVGAKSQHQGIEVFNVTVKGGEHLPNSLGTLSTTAGDLDTINIASEVLLGQTSFASLEIRDGFNQDLNLVNAANFRGDLALGTDRAIVNLENLIATGGGNVTFNGNITNANTADPLASTGIYDYTTGAGNDTIDVTFNGDAVDTIGTGLDISTGAGADNVTVEMIGGNLSQGTMDRLDNLKISTGAGEDSIENIGTADFYISAGSDSDFVYINSIDSTLVASADANTGSWTFSTATGNPTWNERVLYKATATVTFAGFEQTVAIDTTQANNFKADQVLINQAIIKAISTNPELARLLDTDLGTGDQQLFIKSLVEGANNLSIQINQPDVVAVAPAGAGQVLLNSGDLGAVRAGLVQTGVAGIDSQSDAATVAGAVVDGDLNNIGGVGNFLAANDGGSDNETAVENYSTINMGTGSNDLVVLNSYHNASANTLEFTDAWGKVSVVNFFEDAAQTVISAHILDFTAFLTDRVGTATSSSDLSANPVMTSKDVDSAASIDFQANEVSIVNDFAQNIVAPANETWANLGAAQLQNALNGTANWGNITGGGAVAAEPANFIGNSYNNIVMIENDLNAGEYKVFEVTATGTTAANVDTTFSVELLGVIDFGNTINATAVFA